MESGDLGASDYEYNDISDKIALIQFLFLFKKLPTKKHKIHTHIHMYIQHVCVCLILWLEILMFHLYSFTYVL